MKIIRTILVLSMIISCISCNTSSQKEKGESMKNAITFMNPLLPKGPDPWALWHEGKYRTCFLPDFLQNYLSNNVPLGTKCW